jgi:NAD+ kinase
LKEWERETGGRLRHSLVSRDSLSEKAVRGKDLVVALGGDGTTLIASHWISSSFSSSSREGDDEEKDDEDDDDDGGEDASSSFVRPKLIGINTDPAVLAPCLTFTKKAEDERRSTGWLCAADANDVEDVLREILFASSEASPLLPQDVSSDGKESSDISNSSSTSSSSSSLKRRPIRANRIRVKVNGQTWKTMPLALNDVLICHNSPAALSRYSVLLEESDLVNKPPPAPLSDETAPTSEVSKAYYHIRSSGLRLCTALGSTAAMKSAGGYAMSRNDQRIQFHDREPIYYDHEPKPPGRGRGFYDANKTTKFRWNTRVGKIFVDGAHVCHDIKIGDEIEVESAIGDEIEIYCKNFRNIALT